MNLSAVKLHNISVIAFALVLVLILYSAISDVSMIALILFLIVLAIMLM